MAKDLCSEILSYETYGRDGGEDKPKKNRRDRGDDKTKKKRFINSNWDDRDPIIKALYCINYFL